MRSKYFNFVILIIFYFQVSYANNKQKIVTLAPNLTEIVFALDLGDQLVGNTLICDYPIKAKSIFKVGQYNDPNLEKILTSGATVVLATKGNPITKLNKLKSYGIKIIEVNPERAEDLPVIIKEVAKKLGVEKKGEIIAKRIQEAMDSLENKPKKSNSFLFALQFNPIYSVSEETWLGGLFLKSGLKNIVGKSVIKYPIISEEYLIKNRPDIILVGSVEGKNKKESLTLQTGFIKKIYGNDIDKIKVIIVPDDVLVRPGPRIIEGIKFIESL
ncbi:ABC transporter substrate-binding protein [Fluviispira sanaruensis]|uniref:Periplasmic binding protein n=1 Tax=Fluviispira sanaruensis TaxID=2493639 RepID=A0A4P2VND2_FLUSA|nr:helical backbone metal receptor [Fluviispira sanaruensis]BBH54591.1 periplasmic binding protein [Fluviispira sanaruensis]